MLFFDSIVARLFFLTAGAVVLCGLHAEVTVKPRIVEQNAFEVMGIEARTNNAKEAGPEGVIGKQWERFMREGLQQQIPDKSDHNIYAVYTNYASDANGDYTFVLGVKVRPSPGRLIPAGMVLKKIPAGRYAVFTSERGPVQKIVVETWKRIWERYPSPGNSQRAYRADFEVYDQRTADPKNAQVEIYVGLK